MGSESLRIVSARKNSLLLEVLLVYLPQEVVLRDYPWLWAQGSILGLWNARDSTLGSTSKVCFACIQPRVLLLAFRLNDFVKDGNLLFLFDQYREK